MQHCSLKDLSLQDKRKVAKLIKQVVSMKEENDRSVRGWSKAMKELELKNKQLNIQNKEIVKENANCRSKLMHSLVMIKSYQQQIRALEKGKELRNIISNSLKLNVDEDELPVPALDTVSEEETADCQEVQINPAAIENETNDIDSEQTDEASKCTCSYLEGNSSCPNSSEAFKLKFAPSDEAHGRFIKVSKACSCHVRKTSDMHFSNDSYVHEKQELNKEGSNNGLDSSLLELIREVEVISAIYGHDDNLNQPWMSNSSFLSSNSCLSEEEWLSELLSDKDI